MVSIEIPETTPRLEVDPNLRAQLSVFSFDTERYIAGLALAGVPNEAIDTLEVKFGRGIFFDGDVDYKEKTHRVEIDISSKNPIAAGSHGRTFEHREEAIGHGLASTAKTMADYVLKHPDAVELARNSRGPALRTAGLATAVSAGAVAGASYFEATGRPVVSGAIVGFLGGMLSDLAALIGLDSLPKNKQRNQKVLEHHRAIKERAENFASTEETSRLFNGIVKVTFVD